jgi:hypothetical protein
MLPDRRSEQVVAQPAPEAGKALFDYVLRYDFDRDPAKIHATDAKFNQSAVQ